MSVNKIDGFVAAPLAVNHRYDHRRALKDIDGIALAVVETPE